MRAPIGIVTLHTGEMVDMESLYSSRPLAIVFLRHFGCIFCREQIAQLRDYPNENIVMIAMGKVEETREFRENMESPQTYISDPNKTLYEQFGLRRGSFAQIFNPNTFRRGVQAMRSGSTLLNKPMGDTMMLAGTFIVGTDGEILHSHLSSDASDNLSGSAIADLLGKATHKKTTAV